MTSVSFRQGEVRLNFVRSGNKVVAIVDRGETRLYGLPYMGGVGMQPPVAVGPIHFKGVAFVNNELRTERRHPRGSQ